MGKMIISNIVKALITVIFTGAMFFGITGNLSASQAGVNADRDLHLKKAVLVFELEGYDDIFYQPVEYDLQYDADHEIHLIELSKDQIIGRWDQDGTVLCHADLVKGTSETFTTWSLVATSQADGVQILAQYPEN